MVQFTRLHAQNEASLAFNRINMPHTVQAESIVTINNMKGGFIRIFILFYYHYYTNLADFVKFKKKNKFWWLTNARILI